MSDPQNRFFKRFFLVVACALIALAPASFAQVTTGTLAGAVTAGGEAIPGVTVEAVHTPTGTRYDTVSGANGRFVIPNVRVGGPYRVTGTLEGFRPFEATNITVALGQTTEVAVTLALAAVTEAITVTADVDPIINPNRTGATSSVSEEAIQSLPTVNRSLQDFARTNPYFVVDAADASATRVAVAGRNNRYNTIQIDGAVNNDLFGLADTGTPGGQADTQPISLEAVQEIQLVITPYDVRQSGFTGGGINAITRSGSNNWHGSLYGTQRDEDFVGELNGNKVSTFKSDQFGGSLGGPILQDRLFFFASGEQNSNENPTGFSADGSTINQFRAPALAQGVADTLRTKYGYEPGGLGEFVFGTGSDLWLLKLDWNAAANHMLTLRHNFVDAIADRIESNARTSTSVFSFEDHYYDFTSKANSTVLQINSTLGATLYNEGRIGFQTIRDRRATGELFPHVEITEAGSRVNAGVNRFSQANALDQEILEITDDVTWVLGNHTLTLGTHNEFFTFRNLFLDAALGAYTFTSLADFQAGKAATFAVGFSNTGRDDVEFDVAQYGFYAGDRWRMNDNFSFTGGLRVDLPTFPDSPSTNPLLVQALGIDTGDAPERMVLWQPRFGFNWSAGGTQQVRGGTGIFAGRTPYVWISNNYQNSGVEFSNLSVSGASTPAFDPTQPPPRTGAAFLPRLDAIDPDFEFPQVWRTTLAYDRTLPLGIEATIEGIWSQSVKDAYYTNENLVQTGTMPDGRPRYARKDPRIDAVYFLRNTDEGEELNLSLQARKRFARGLDIRAYYTYSDAESLADLTSSRAVSNFRFSPQVDSVHPQVGTTFFEIEHRGLITATYNLATGPLRHNLGLVYNVQSGAPLTYLFSNDVNFDNVNQAGNDPIYVPRSADEVVFRSGLTWEQLDAFISSDDCLDSQRGQIYERNSCKQPYTRQLDFHYGLALPVRVAEVEITADVLNLMNLIDEDRGLVRTTPFNTYNLVNGSVDSATGKWSYAPGFSGAVTPGNQFSLHNTRSRWTARLGMRVSF